MIMIIIMFGNGSKHKPGSVKKGTIVSGTLLRRASKISTGEVCCKAAADYHSCDDAHCDDDGLM